MTFGDNTFLRTLLIAIAGIVASLGASFAKPVITARLSEHEIIEIETAIKAVTDESIFLIDSVISDDRTPDSIPVKFYSIRVADNGQVRSTPVTRYQKINEVSVLTGLPGQKRGFSFLLRRMSNGKWRLLTKGAWIH